MSNAKLQKWREKWGMTGHDYRRLENIYCTLIDFERIFHADGGNTASGLGRVMNVLREVIYGYEDARGQV